MKISKKKLLNQANKVCKGNLMETYKLIYELEQPVIAKMPVNKHCSST